MRLITHASIYVDILDMAVNRVNPKSPHAEQSSALSSPDVEGRAAIMLLTM